MGYMMKITENKQLGVSFSGFLIAVVIFVFVAISGMKLIPTYMENAKIQNIFDVIVHDPEMRNAQVKDIRLSFAKRASIDAITAINESDIEISKDSSGISLSASYAVKIPIVRNASLLIEFNPSSSK